MLTKSNCPSEIHWWSTLAPSSSTSRFTSRSRSGCDWSVRRPWSVSVVSMRYVGIGPPSVPGARLYRHPCGLVVVEQRRAEEQDRLEDEAGEEGRDVHRLLARAVQERSQQHLREEDDEQQRPQRAERMHVVRAGELEPALERPAQRQPLVDDRRHRETEGREPEEAREDRQRREAGCGERAKEELPRRPRADDEHAGTDVGRRGQQDPARDDGREPGMEAGVVAGDGDRGRADPERERAPEVPAVEADRLGDELPDRPAPRGERRGELVRAAATLRLRVLHAPTVAACQLQCPPMGRGSRPTRRWANDRQRKKKDRDKKRAVDAGTARKSGRTSS